MRATRFLPIVMAIVLVAGTGVVLAADSGGDGGDIRAAIEASSEGKATTGNCYWKSVPDAGGKIRVKIPAYCKNRMCRINVSWFGDPIGAYSAGFGPGIDYIQFNDGWWGAGPSVNIGGWGGLSPDGWGRNGDGTAHTLVFAGDGDGSYIWLGDDDPGFENTRGKMTLEVDNSGSSTYTGVTFWACKMG